MKQQEFQQRVEEAMKKCVKKHQHHHPLYQPTKITEYQIDEERKLAAWILFEQIDTDRLTPETKETLLKLAGPGHPISKLIPEDVVEELREAYRKMNPVGSLRPSHWHKCNPRKNCDGEAVVGLNL